MNDNALTCACENGHTEIAEILLKAGIDLVSLLRDGFYSEKHNSESVVLSISIFSPLLSSLHR